MEKIINTIQQTWIKTQRIVILAVATLMVVVPIFVLSQTASAAQEEPRSLAINTPIAGATATYTISFNPASTTQIQSYQIQGCTTALGTCTAPTGLSISTGTPSNSGFQGATAFTKDTTSTTGTYACNTTNILCGNRTDTTAQTTGTSHVITDTGVTNQNATNCSSAANCTFFLRIYTYSDTGYLTQVDYGTVASSTTQQFTVNAAIQEQLAFCIGNTTADTATATIPTCSTITGTSVNLGNLTSADVSVSPVAATYNGNASNGLAELTTNAYNGASVSYSAVQQSGTNHQGGLRVVGATCNSGTINTDQCITSVGTTKATLVSGTEDFGMAIAGIDCSNVGSAYTCTYSSGTFNLNPATNYNCNGNANGGHSNTYPSDTGLVSGTTACSYAWDESGTSNTIASSTTIVGGEALLLKFAATPSLVTPTGAYSAQANFIATPTF